MESLWPAKHYDACADARFAEELSRKRVESRVRAAISDRFGNPVLSLGVPSERQKAFTTRETFDRRKLTPVMARFQQAVRESSSHDLAGEHSIEGSSPTKSTGESSGQEFEEHSDQQTTNKAVTLGEHSWILGLIFLDYQRWAVSMFGTLQSMLRQLRHTSVLGVAMDAIAISGQFKTVL